MFVEQLPNGMTLIVKTVPNKVVTLDCWVNVGSSREAPEENGACHFLEHMLFKGTPRFGVGELDKVIMGVGGMWNAGTSKDFTHYHVTVASPFFDTALDALSDMLCNASLDAGEFDKEKPVILEEYRRKQDNPGGLLFDELYEAMFEKGPYRQSVLGSFESISALTRGQLHGFFTRYYVPANMVFMVVGDVDESQAAAKVGQAFAHFDRPAPPPPASPPQTVFARGAFRQLRRDVNETYFAYAVPAPSIADADAVIAADIASVILGDGRSSRLHQLLKEQKRLVHSVSTGYPTHRHESFFYVFAVLERGNVDAVLGEIRQQLSLLARDLPSEREMAKARRVICNEFDYGIETNTGMSGTIGYYHTLTGSNEFLDNYIGRVKSARAADVSRVASQFLALEGNTVIVEPQDSGENKAGADPGGRD